MGKKEAAQRKTFKGDFKGPDRFKGNKTAIAAWKAAGKPTNKHTGAVGSAFSDNPNPGMAVEPGSYDDAGNLIPTVKPVKADTPVNTFNPGTVTDVGKRLVGDYAGATQKFKGKYAGPDKYKGLAPKGGKWKGKYIGADARKGVAKPTVTPSVAGSAEDAVLKKLLAARKSS